MRASAIELIDDAYRQLAQEFAARDPADPSGTWYGPDQTVGFWIRRMAQETVIHRIDAELGAREQVTPSPMTWPSMASTSCSRSSSATA